LFRSVGHGGRVVLVVVDAGLLDLRGELGDALLRGVVVGAGSLLVRGHCNIVTHEGDARPPRGRRAAQGTRRSAHAGAIRSSASSAASSSRVEFSGRAEGSTRPEWTSCGAPVWAITATPAAAAAERPS